MINPNCNCSSTMGCPKCNPLLNRKSFWDNKPFLYGQMLKHHKELRLFVEKFVKDKNIGSIIEVGGGDNRMSYFVEKYMNIDLNRTLPQTVCGDFTKLDLSVFKGRYELLLALNVVEHCEGYFDFIKQIKEVQPSYAVVSFFNGVHRNVDCLTKKRKYEDEFWNNKYSKKKIEDTLYSLEINNYNWAKMGKDNILILWF